MPADSFEFSVSSPYRHEVSWASGATYPAQISKIVRLNLAFFEYPQYDSFRVRIVVNYYNSQINWLTITGTGLVDGIINITSFVRALYINFQNLEQLGTDKYEAEINFILEGSLNNTWTEVEGRFVNVVLNAVNGEPIKTEKQLYTMYYDKSADLLTGETHINILNNTNNYDLLFEGDSETFVSVPSFTNFFDLVYSSPSRFPSSGEYNINAFIGRYISGNYKRLWAFQIKIIVIDAAVVVSPQSLSFWVKKNMNEVKTSDLNIVNFFGKNLTITKPDWLTISQNTANSSVIIQVSNVEPVNLTAGRYEGNIDVLYESKIIQIPVVLDVFSFYTHNFQEEYNFCLDKKIITVFRNNSDARFVRITANMKFRTAYEEKVLTVPYTIPYYQDSVKLDIGKNIHRYFIKNHTSIFEEGTSQYNFDNKVHIYPCEFSLKIEELDINFNPMYEETISNLKFYPGKKPLMFPFLTNYAFRSRAYGSKHIFSFISGLVTAKQLFDIPVSENGLEPGCIARVKVEQNENKISFSDIKEIMAAGKTITYFNIPDDEDLINVQWENQNLSPESITFSGDNNKPIDFSHLFQDNIFTGEVEKFDTTKTKTMSINTGFILAAEEDLIEELMSSKFCVLEIGGKYITGAPSGSKLVTWDKKKQLKEFDLEFKIYGN
ncbi:hypothetical protein ACFO4P_17175 [Epilithonimonas pallida]|uniref:F5/8 type C domain-containing protein n=1 Tax=Epilithonimonas pallida TaxID=373671 RepID=A0ABY1R7D0_9FLAO|nr:hypothetical protein [Epilithonimonas pallida]SMP94734.1 hypothetical protein SAMN05421679_106121 [Epilithonimonas pallida]